MYRVNGRINDSINAHSPGGVTRLVADVHLSQSMADQFLWQSRAFVGLYIRLQPKKLNTFVITRFEHIYTRHSELPPQSNQSVYFA